MKITPVEITIRELVEDYKESDFSGVRGYGELLNIRPAYQREMVYTEAEQVAVIESILDGFPIGIMYWAKNKSANPKIEYEYEVIDGQQRTISICRYVSRFQFAVRGKLFPDLDEETRNKILDYKILVYQCEGTPDETLAWFARINIAGKALSAQELRNAAYTGTWLASAKEYFKWQGPAYDVCSKYIKTPKKTLENRDFDWRRWDGLELALTWACGDKTEEAIRAYMLQHRNDADAEEFFEEFQEIFDWIEETFPPENQEGRDKYLKGSDWHEMYEQFHDNTYDAEKLEEEISRLMDDDEITNKHGIYWYVLDPANSEHKLNLRSFPKETKQQMYAQQKHRCPVCCSNGYFDQYTQNDMEADHLIPWSKGGKTSIENGAMLCSSHNNLKSNKNVSEQQVKDWLDVLASDGFEDLLAKYEAGEVELSTPKDWLDALKEMS